MPGQECHFAALEIAEHEGVRWFAEWCFDALFAHICESGHGVKSAATDDAYLNFSQGSFLFCSASSL
jgi:hypothetical protein